MTVSRLDIRFTKLIYLSSPGISCCLFPLSFNPLVVNSNSKSISLFAYFLRTPNFLVHHGFLGDWWWEITGGEIYGIVLLWFSIPSGIEGSGFYFLYTERYRALVFWEFSIPIVRAFLRFCFKYNNVLLNSIALSSCFGIEDDAFCGSLYLL